MPIGLAGGHLRELGEPSEVGRHGLVTEGAGRPNALTTTGPDVNPEHTFAVAPARADTDAAAGTVGDHIGGQDRSLR